jgi:uncharacterized protein (DUF2252 family)
MLKRIVEQSRNPLDLLAQQEAERLPWLLPLRRSRMAANPFAFFRGAAVVMAADLAREPHSGLMVQLCGDAHLLNFGFYGSPELQLLFDINDFDETHSGPFEWDLIRLATSLILAARSLGLSDKDQGKVCRRGVRSYGEAMANFAAMPFLQMWVSKLPLQELIDQQAGACLQAHLKQVVATALQRDSGQAVRKLCELNSSGELQFRHQPPLIVRYAELPSDVLFGMKWRQRFDHMYADYLRSVRPELRHLLSHFRLSDAALKAVGVGSVGTRCAIGVLVGDHPDDVLVLQSKQAEPSVLAPYVDQPAPEHQGERVVKGQRLMQTASDGFLGWTTSPEGRPYYWRQFRNWKGSVDVTQLDARGLKDYGKLCGWALAKAHARSGDRRAISATINELKLFSARLLEQALHHADLVEQDHQTLLEAIATGRIKTSERP